jgi:Arc/MetJ-type ribon-helix-helix transcriptional regulator
MALPITPLKLPAALEEFVASQVRKGAYRSRKAAIVAAVLHQKRRSEQLVAYGMPSRVRTRRLKI